LGGIEGSSWFCDMVNNHLGLYIYLNWPFFPTMNYKKLIIGSDSIKRLTYINPIQAKGCFHGVVLPEHVCAGVV